MVKRVRRGFTQQTLSKHTTRTGGQSERIKEATLSVCEIAN